MVIYKCINKQYFVSQNEGFKHAITRAFHLMKKIQFVSVFVDMSNEVIFAQINFINSYTR